jgi:hypothetical protein
MAESDEDYVIEFDIHHPVLKEIPTEIRLRSPLLLDVPEFFIIRDKSDLDENFPASIRLRDGALLAVKSEIVHHKPELQECRVRIRIPSSELFQIPKTVNLYSPSILQIDQSFNLNPLAKIIRTGSDLQFHTPVLHDVQISLYIRPPTILNAETHFRLRQNGTLLEVPNELVNVEEEGLYSIKHVPNYFIFNKPHFSSIYTKENETYSFAKGELLSIPSTFDSKFSSPENSVIEEITPEFIQQPPQLKQIPIEYKITPIDKCQMKNIITSIKVTFYKVKEIMSEFIKNDPILKDFGSEMFIPAPYIRNTEADKSIFIQPEPVILDTGSTFIINTVELNGEIEE